MKIFKSVKMLLIAVLAVALCPFSAKADVFNYSYTFLSGDVVSGSLSGTQNGIFIESVSNVSAFYNGNPFIGNPDLYQPYIFTPGCCWVSGTPVISFDGNLNNFMFSDVPAGDPVTNSFDMVGTDQDFWVTGDKSPLRWANVLIGSSYVAIDVTANSPTYPGANGGFDATRWSLTPAAAVPEPATMLLLGTGLMGLVGFRRKSVRNIV